MIPARWSPRPVRTVLRSLVEVLAESARAAFPSLAVGSGVVLGMTLGQLLVGLS